MHEAPSSPVNISRPFEGIKEPSSAQINTYSSPISEGSSRRTSQNIESPPSAHLKDSPAALPFRTKQTSNDSRHGSPAGRRRSSGHARSDHPDEQLPALDPAPQLQYHAFDDEVAPKREQHMANDSVSSSSSGGHGGPSAQHLGLPPTNVSRPPSAQTLGSDLRSRAHSPHLAGEGSDRGSPSSYGRAVSTSRRSPDSRPISYIDLLSNVPYSEQIAPAPKLDNPSLEASVGNNASLLDTKKTLDMYRANVKKTKDPAIQYEFAMFMIGVAQSQLGAHADDRSPSPLPDRSAISPSELIREARHILQQLADRGYPFAQYILADGYVSGLFSKGKEDYDKAFPLFVAASKHGHAEAGYRAALCYEFGAGCRKDYPKAVQFYRQAASKNHPGAATRLGKACLTGDMGLGKRDREGVKWLKRATDSADPHHPTAPYELGLLHMTGYGDDVFKDEAYAAQLFTTSAELGHAESNFILGDAYEHGKLSCPRDPALSVHFYNGAAQQGHPQAMMALCAWYMVGAEPVLEKDENEAYEWAKRAAESGLVKAEYALGYFTEMGIGCRRDPLEANVWYVRAADQGDDRAKQRLAIIRAAASGNSGIPMSKERPKSKELLGGGGKEGKGGRFKLW
ncbi:chitin synthase activator Chs3 [Cryomyces antarcticus]|nr:Chitin synthase 4 [Cryomyces antarcticus]